MVIVHVIQKMHGFPVQTSIGPGGLARCKKKLFPLSDAVGRQLTLCALIDRSVSNPVGMQAFGDRNKPGDFAHQIQDTERIRTVTNLLGSGLHKSIAILPEKGSAEQLPPYRTEGAVFLRKLACRHLPAFQRECRRKPFPQCFFSGFIYHCGAAYNEIRLFFGCYLVHHLEKIRRIAVVRIQNGEIFAFQLKGIPADQVPPSCVFLRRHRIVYLVAEQYDPRIPAGIFPQDFSGSTGGTIVLNQEIQIRTGLLQNTFDCLTKPTLGRIVDNHHKNSLGLMHTVCPLLIKDNDNPTPYPGYLLSPL